MPSLTATRVLVFALFLTSVSSWTTNPHHVVATRQTHLFAGFGGSKNTKSNDAKLKPKQQWDRYNDMKGLPKISVGVRASSGDEWLTVGKIKAKEGVSVEAAVARQRSIIVEHAKRLFPLQISPKDVVEWAFLSDDNEWKVVDKNIEMPDNVDKLIGFEGTPDPQTGFYCVYNEGRIVYSNDVGDVRPSSKKIK